ncbi:MAG: methyltransferase domain-containing protein [Sulfolobales archaeon]
MSNPRQVVYEVLEVYDEISRGYASWRSRAWELVRVLRGGVVLDLGSGHCINGLQVALMREAKYLICADIAPSMLVEARKLLNKKGFLKADFVAADASRIPLRDSVVDSLISIALVHHLPREELIKVAREVSRVLKPGGLALITSWSMRQLRFVKETLVNCIAKLLGIRKAFEYRVKWRTRGKTYVRKYFLYEVDELKRATERAGLKVISAGYVSRSNSLNSFVILTKNTYS